MRTMMIGLVALGALGVAACGHEEPARSPNDTTSTTAGRPATGGGSLGPGISGSTESGQTTGPDGTPYQGNVDPSNPASNRNKRPEPNDVRTAPLAK